MQAGEGVMCLKEKGCPFCSLLPAVPTQPVVAVITLNLAAILCAVITPTLWRKSGGAEDGEDAHIKVSLDFSKAEEVTVCQFLEERKALYLEDFLFWKLLFCKHMDLFYINLKY